SPRGTNSPRTEWQIGHLRSPVEQSPWQYHDGDHDGRDWGRHERPDGDLGHHRQYDRAWPKPQRHREPYRREGWRNGQPGFADASCTWRRPASSIARVKIS